MQKPTNEAVCAAQAHLETLGVPYTNAEAIALGAAFERYADQRVDHAKNLVAPYAWHAYNCPKMNDHACTCGMEAVRMELWGKPDRPAPEPFVKPHEAYCKPPKKRLAYEQLRNKT